MKTSHRPMTDREKADLRALVSPTTAALRAALFVALVVAVGWFFRGVQMLVGGGVGGPADLPFWLLPTVVVAALVYVRAGRLTGGRTLRERIRRDLERGEVALHRVRATRALEAPEIEDEGPVFFVLDEGGETLFFAGQQMARYKARGFPWREFEIEETPESRRFLRLRRLGDSLSDVEGRAPLTLDEARELGTLTAAFGTLPVGLDALRRPS